MLNLLVIAVLIGTAQAAEETGAIQADKPDSPMGAEIRKAFDQREHKRLHRWPARSWTLASEAEAFIARIGRSCLSSADSSLAADGKKITIIDDPRCAKEIEKASMKWDPAMDTYVVRRKPGTPGDRGARRLSPTPHCPCEILLK
jgi:hypothetical protein